MNKVTALTTMEIHKHIIKNFYFRVYKFKVNTW